MNNQYRVKSMGATILPLSHFGHTHGLAMGHIQREGRIGRTESPCKQANCARGLEDNPS